MKNYYHKYTFNKKLIMTREYFKRIINDFIEYWDLSIMNSNCLY